MPDLLGFQITPLGSASVTVPRFRIECQVVKSSDQTKVLLDVTGANAIQFPAVLATLSTEDRRDLLEVIAHFLIRKAAGV